MIASAGESLIDFTSVADDRGQLTGFRLHPGGSPFNVAIGVGRLAALADRRALDRASLERLDGPGWLEAARFASATAALTCERAGADPPVRAAVLERLAEA